MIFEVELRGWDYSVENNMISKEKVDQYEIGFKDQGIRNVEIEDNQIPSKEELLNNEKSLIKLLELIFMNGQNDHQISNKRSLMVGDIVKLPIIDKKFRIEDIGWKEIK